MGLYCPCRAQVDWWAPENAPPQPRKVGATVYENFPLEDVLDYIDWNPFFQVRDSDCGPRFTVHGACFRV